MKTVMRWFVAASTVGILLACSGLNPVPETTEPKEAAKPEPVAEVTPVPDVAPSPAAPSQTTWTPQKIARSSSGGGNRPVGVAASPDRSKWMVVFITDSSTPDQPMMVLTNDKSIELDGKFMTNTDWIVSKIANNGNWSILIYDELQDGDGQSGLSVFEWNGSTVSRTAVDSAPADLPLTTGMQGMVGKRPAHKLTSGRNGSLRLDGETVAAGPYEIVDSRSYVTVDGKGWAALVKARDSDSGPFLVVNGQAFEDVAYPDGFIPYDFAFSKDGGHWVATGSVTVIDGSITKLNTGKASVAAGTEDGLFWAVVGDSGTRVFEVGPLTQ